MKYTKVKITNICQDPWATQIEEINCSKTQAETTQTNQSEKHIPDVLLPETSNNTTV